MGLSLNKIMLVRILHTCPVPDINSRLIFRNCFDNRNYLRNLHQIT